MLDTPLISWDINLAPRVAVAVARKGKLHRISTASGESVDGLRVWNPKTKDV